MDNDRDAQIYRWIQHAYGFVKGGRAMNDIEFADAIAECFSLENDANRMAYDFLQQHALRRDIGDFIREQQEMQDD